ncbi:S-formylglutathione hydrolase FrmB [Paraoerskovia marina]|uniref:S-formylglutathione hydrolase FrmB n=1 Tax=Paraoerskovia marina TaxID=545619 RepID=A0A1H1VVI6_9CELL|nr:alpha/beta hydrolase family protein [Paraoerskovia marina]SDS88715.1 S-formylglutathione hydrolase FrmB [Paraoerskovia marina]
MAHMRCDFFSDVLEMGTSVSVILPQAPREQIGGPAPVHTTAEAPPVLYLLHGLSDDDTAWTRNTSIERYAAEHQVAVVMPRVERSFYHDEAHGQRFWTYLTEELPAVVASFFRVSQAREDTFVAGLSMGGYGALRWALSEPERFAAAASFSGVLDVAEPGLPEARADLYATVFGSQPTAGTDSDLLHLLRTRVAAGTDLPALRVTCGTEDALFSGNERFLAEARHLGVDVAVDLGPGDHEWGYWDAQVRAALAWLPLAADGDDGRVA